MRATCVVHFGFAVWALDKQQVAFSVGAICNVVALISTVVALGEYMTSDGLASSAVKSKVFALEQRGATATTVFYVMAIGGDPARQLANQCVFNTMGGLFSNTHLHTILTRW